MRIPKEAAERQQFYANLVRECLVSREKRFQFYLTLRNYLLFGTPDSSGSTYNKIGSTVETLCSFIYAPDSARFNIHLGTLAPKEDLAKVPKLAAEVNDQWKTTSTHILFGRALPWSFAFGTMLFKVIWTNNLPRTYVVEPHQFGVLREDVPELADQEAFVHCYTSTRTQLLSELEGQEDKKDKIPELMRQVGRSPGEGSQGRFNEGMSRLIISSGIAAAPGSTIGGGMVDGGLTGNSRVAYEYAPEVQAELVDMYELYVWNDEINDYQMVTLASPNVVIYDRKQSGVPGIPNFTKLTPLDTLYDYFWGESFVARLTQLQDWRNVRVAEIRDIMSRQADPPMSTAGFGGIAEEKMQAFRKAGGLVSSPMPGAKVDVHEPKMPTNTWAELSEIDKEFDDTAGIGNILQGKGESGVRSKGQADLMARLGSARPKKKALIVEECAEDVATLMFRNLQEHSKQRFTVGDEKNPNSTVLAFTPAQFTSDFEIKVDAHSSSPIFVEDRKNDAMSLFEAKAIDREALIEAFDPPGKQQLLETLKVKIIPAEQQAAAQEAAQQKGAT